MSEEKNFIFINEEDVPIQDRLNSAPLSPKGGTVSWGVAFSEAGKYRLVFKIPNT